MKHELPELPYAMDALEPLISGKTLEYHYGKHHAGYVNKLNAAIKNTPYENLPLEDVIEASENEPGVFNNAAQNWNHTFYWNSMTPGAGDSLSKDFRNRIAVDFGSLEQLQKDFQAAAAGQFGSGWAWLYSDEKGRLGIASTGNAETLLHSKKTPLIVCDVWEHAYYLDYFNVRGDYLDAFWKLINWKFAEDNYFNAV